MKRYFKLFLAVFICLIHGYVKASAASVGIILVGDTGTGGLYQFKVAEAIHRYCQTNSCDLGLLLGDNFYPAGVSDMHDKQFIDKFEKVYQNLNFKFYPVLGNHDYQGNIQAQIKYQSEHWQMPNKNYSKYLELLDLYAIDTNNFNAATVEWLESQFKNPRHMHKWKIVYGHHPVFSSGKHGDTQELKKYLAPLLEKYRIDFYISGHDHDKELIHISNTNYVISGAGASVRDFEDIKKSSLFHRSSLGFAYLLLSDNSATLRFINTNAEIEFEKNLPNR